MKKFEIKNTKPFSLPIGKRGEMLAAGFLVKQGCEIIEKNYKCPLGEIDLIVRDEEKKIVFVEVKTRRRHRYGAPEEAVDLRKCRKLVNLAQFYLKAEKLQDQSCSFGVVSVTWKDAGPDMKFIRDAFSLDDLELR